MEIENSYQNRSNCIDAGCVLGYKFLMLLFISMKLKFLSYTWKLYWKRYYKPSGNRSVRRICVEDKVAL